MGVIHFTGGGGGGHFSDDFDRSTTTAGELGGVWNQGTNTFAVSRVDNNVAEFDKDLGVGTDDYYVDVAGLLIPLEITYDLTVGAHNETAWQYIAVGDGSMEDVIAGDYAYCGFGGAATKLYLLGATTSFTWATDTYHVKIQLIPGNSTMKVWKTSEAEPATPTLTSTELFDSDITRQRVALRFVIYSDDDFLGSIDNLKVRSLG